MSSYFAPMALSQEHVEGCKFYANRDLILGMLRPESIVIELGTGLGGMSRMLSNNPRVAKVYTVDQFALHTLKELWGRKTKDIFQGKDHERFIRDELARFTQSGKLEILKGTSWEVLERFPDAHFDMVYVDAGHTYEEVKKDADVAVRKMKPDGLLVFNDYTMCELTGEPYGVVQVVNQLCVEGGFRMVAFALHKEMFCDVALKRASI